MTNEGSGAQPRLTGRKRREAYAAQAEPKPQPQPAMEYSPSTDNVMYIFICKAAEQQQQPYLAARVIERNSQLYLARKKIFPGVPIGSLEDALTQNDMEHAGNLEDTKYMSNTIGRDMAAIFRREPEGNEKVPTPSLGVVQIAGSKAMAVVRVRYNDGMQAMQLDASILDAYATLRNQSIQGL